MRVLILIMGIWIFSSCYQSQIQFDDVNSNIVDSFEIYISYEDELLNIKPIKDSLFISYSYQGQCFYIYKTDSQGNKQIESKKEFKDSNYPISFFVTKNKKYILNGNNELSIDSGAIKYRSLIQSNKPYLKDHYYLSSLNYHPFIVIDSFLYATYYYNNLSDYTNYFKEKTISKYSIKEDRLEFIDNLIPKPIDLVNYQYAFPRFTSYKKDIFIVYPCIDTIFIFNTTTNTLNSIPIANPEFNKPVKYDYSRLLNLSNDFNSYDTKYTLSNFKYYSIIFNPCTKHLVLFYKSPITNDKQFLKLLVLTLNGTKVAHYCMSERLYYDPENYFIIPQQGIAMPLFENYNEENHLCIKYHIYNF